jgi:hypothetical protein
MTAEGFFSKLLEHIEINVSKRHLRHEAGCRRHGRWVRLWVPGVFAGPLFAGCRPGFVMRY